MTRLQRLPSLAAPRTVPSAKTPMRHPFETPTCLWRSSLGSSGDRECGLQEADGRRSEATETKMRDDPKAGLTQSRHAPGLSWSWCRG